jgi:hypothetical protein
MGITQLHATTGRVVDPICNGDPLAPPATPAKVVLHLGNPVRRHHILKALRIGFPLSRYSKLNFDTSQRDVLYVELPECVDRGLALRKTLS